MEAMLKGSLGVLMGLQEGMRGSQKARISQEQFLRLVLAGTDLELKLEQEIKELMVEEAKLSKNFAPLRTSKISQFKSALPQNHWCWPE